MEDAQLEKHRQRIEYYLGFEEVLYADEVRRLFESYSAVKGQMNPDERAELEQRISEKGKSDRQGMHQTLDSLANGAQNESAVRETLGRALIMWDEDPEVQGYYRIIDFFTSCEYILNPDEIFRMVDAYWDLKEKASPEEMAEVRQRIEEKGARDTRMVNEALSKMRKWGRFDFLRPKSSKEKDKRLNYRKVLLLYS